VIFSLLEESAWRGLRIEVVIPVLEGIIFKKKKRKKQKKKEGLVKLSYLVDPLESGFIKTFGKHVLIERRRTNDVSDFFELGEVESMKA